MAVKLNKSRMRNSKIFVILAVIIVLFSRSIISYEDMIHETFDFLGYFLLAVCALGRLYSTAFLGGFKNQTLIKTGAFSIIRNPLYFFSLIGMTGIAFISGHIVIIVCLPIFFIVMYHFLIKREEAFLKEEFGQEYLDYMKSTPRLIPNFKLYNAPDVVDMVPKYLNKAFIDAIWWFSPFPIFELFEYLQEIGVIKTFMIIP